MSGRSLSGRRKEKKKSMRKKNSAHGEGLRTLIPVDGSARSKRAIQWYMDNMNKEENKLILLHVIDARIPVLPDFAQALKSYDDMVGEFAKEVKEIKAQCEDIVASQSEFQFEAELTGEHGVGRTIMRFAKKMDVNHIIIGNRGLDKFRRFLLGSVSRHIVRHTDVPVTLIPEPPSK